MTVAVLAHIAKHANSHEREVEPSGDADDPRWRIIRATLHLHPSDIAGFAGIALSGDDDAARDVVRDAASELERSVLALHPVAGAPIVLAGGLLREGRLVDELVARLGAHGVTAAALDLEPVTGAATLAADAVGWLR